MKPIFQLKDVSVSYGSRTILEKICLDIFENRILCIMGSSGTGKTTLLRTLNRMNDSFSGFQCRGSVLFETQNIYHQSVDPSWIRRKVGLVFQKPCVFPTSIRENLLFGIKHLKMRKKIDYEAITEENLRAVSLWDDVKDRLNHPAGELSQGQQQRLTIARALTVQPRVLLMDEPTASLDQQSVMAIENLVKSLKEKMTLVIVTHKEDQVQRIADDVVFMGEGKIRIRESVKSAFPVPSNFENEDLITQSPIQNPNELESLESISPFPIKGDPSGMNIK